MSGVEQFVDKFKVVRSGLPGSSGWLGAIRDRAMERFSDDGFPTPRSEAWKYTNLAPLVKENFEPAQGKKNGAKPLVSEPAARVVFSNGRVDEGATIASTQKGLTVVPLNQALQTHEALLKRLMGKTDPATGNPVGALNLAMMGDGLLVHVDKNIEIEAPVEALFALNESGQMSHLRLWIALESGSALTLVEGHQGQSRPGWSNLVSEVFVEDGARLTHLKVQEDQGYHLAETRVVLGRDARLQSCYLALGGEIARNDVLVRFDGPGSEARVDGVFLAGEGHQTQFRTVMDHASPHCQSDQLFKGIAAVGGRGLYDGRVIVRKGAQKTDSRQRSNNLLLGDGAEVDAKPQLEIYADDVKCAHGATSGQLDEESVFYLRARGLSEKQAQQLLTEGFVNEVVDRVSVGALRPQLTELLAEKVRHGL